MDTEKLQLALGIMSGRVTTIVGRKQYELLGLEYSPDHAHFTLKGTGWANTLRRRAEDILLEALSE